MEGQTFYWSIMTADDSIKYWCVNSGMTGQVGGFQNPGVCLQAFPSFLPHPLPALLLAPFVARSLTLIPRSLLLNRIETLATQARSNIAGGGGGGGGRDEPKADLKGSGITTQIILKLYKKKKRHRVIPGNNTRTHLRNFTHLNLFVPYVCHTNSFSAWVACGSWWSYSILAL